MVFGTIANLGSLVCPMQVTLPVQRKWFAVCARLVQSAPRRTLLLFPVHLVLGTSRLPPRVKKGPLSRGRGYVVPV